MQFLHLFISPPVRETPNSVVLNQGAKAHYEASANFQRALKITSND